MYDLHIATEGEVNLILAQGLVSIGFHHDNLVQQGVQFSPETGLHYSACPLIALHMTRDGIFTRDELRVCIAQMQGVFDQHGTGESGYWHAEWTAAQGLLTPNNGALPDLTVSFPCHRFQAEPRLLPKEWDIHISVYTHQISNQVRDYLLSCGFYYITRWDKNESGSRCEWYSFTIQGINRANEGRRLFEQMKIWWQQAQLPPAKLKFEVTVAQERCGNPTLVPPTIDSIHWK